MNLLENSAPLPSRNSIMQTIQIPARPPLSEGAPMLRATSARGRIAALLLCVLVMASGIMPSAAMAQQPTASLRGTVTDSAGAPLAAANVHLAGTRQGAMTNQ